MRDDTTKTATAQIDKRLANVQNKTYVELPIAEIQALLALTMPDQTQSERVWNPIAVADSIGQFAKLHTQATGFVYVDRDRALKENRHETQGILSGGETGTVPREKITLFMLRTVGGGRQQAGWWPQIRFPDGRYAFAFAV